MGRVKRVGFDLGSSAEIFSSVGDFYRARAVHGGGEERGRRPCGAAHASVRGIPPRPTSKPEEREQATGLRGRAAE
ncbi:hypothetical protein E2562_017504 [Oryza meyeriana var. granulata]|uniref:Uncharacterized protein n=1 Tax=Oryza meyeriana var. granulata TaxID=110450 RepID=A0A6G1DXV4_9ORYZ|nr:hypothetical protein E2562_017504 [Oryza meyeriana var. granulata]